MNVFGSYRRLLEHSKQAMIAAVELYNKPNFTHREPILSMLLVSAWELCFLAVLSKNKVRIFQPKQPNAPYQTLHLDDASTAVKPFFPKCISSQALLKNLKHLKAYRNQATHYYHDEQSKHGIYALAQASVINYRDFLIGAFGADISNEVSLVLLPLTFSEPPDFVQYFRKTDISKASPFIAQLFSDLKALDGEDTSRFVTKCHIKLEHSKDITFADIVATKSNGNAGSILIRNMNPDDSHPLLQKDIIGNKSQCPNKNLNVRLSSNTFQAIVWKYKLKDDKDYCWTHKKTGSTQYSPKIFSFLNNLNERDIQLAKTEFNSRARRKKK